jgi:hypothetical protein
MKLYIVLEMREPTKNWYQFSRDSNCDPPERKGVLTIAPPLPVLILSVVSRLSI